METGKLYISSDGKFSLLYHSIDSKINELRVLYKKLDDESRPFELFNFFTLTSAVYELSLNFICLYQCHNIYPDDQYKKIYDILIRWRFEDKIRLFPSLFSNGKFKSNTNTKWFTDFQKFVATRNKLMHPKPQIVDFSHNIPDNTATSFEEIVNYVKENKMGGIHLSAEINTLEYFGLKYSDCKLVAENFGKYIEEYYNPITQSDIKSTELLIEV